MKSTSRKFNRCMFCRNTDEVSKEHIFTRSFANRFLRVRMLSANTVPVLNPRALPTKQAKRYARSAGDSTLHVTSQTMCKDCNEYLGKEVDQIVRSLVKLFKGKTNIIPASEIRLAQRYFQRIALLFDLETCAFDPELMSESDADRRYNEMHRKRPPYFTDAERFGFRNGDLLPDIKVYLGKHYGQGGKQQEMTVVPFIDGPKRVVYCVDRLAVVVAFGPTAELEDSKFTYFPAEQFDFKIPSSRIVYDHDVKLTHAPITIYFDGTFERVW